MKGFLFICILAFVRGNEEDFRIIDNIHPEKGCSLKGGICTIAADCPDGYQSKESGLCPSQQHQGIECCYSVSVKETRCEKNGGTCMSDSLFCNPDLIYKASNCPTNTKCCILV